jgi:arylsulfatase A-like enzyme
VARGLFHRRRFLAAAGASLAGPLGGAPAAPPNFVLILADNLGYGDLGCYGSTRHRTPHIDRLAREGMRFTSFYAASGVCTPSRASLLTGCYPRRVGLDRTEPDGHVLRPVSPNGLHPDEVTIAEILKERGYSTSIVGKWHLGDQSPFLPTRQGFDDYFGIPYSEDMVGGKRLPGQTAPWPPLPLMEDERVIEAPAERASLTRRYTARSVEIIRRRRGRPFFLFLSHALPGSTPTPFAGEAFRGRSANGPYGDAVEELDGSTGEVLAALKETGQDGNTLVVWTSDNGAVRRDPPQGSNLPLGGWGYTTAEGGQRIPCIARWPGRIPAGLSLDALATLMDWLPTFAALAGARMPEDRIIDGKDIRPLLTGTSSRTPHEAFYYYYGPQLQAVRSGRWKLYLPLERKWLNFAGRTAKAEAALYDLDRDAGETRNVAAAHPDVAGRLLALAEKARADLGDVDRPGKGQRPAGRFPNPVPRVRA